MAATLTFRGFLKTSQFERFLSKPAHSGGPNGPFSPGNPAIEVGGFAPHLDRWVPRREGAAWTPRRGGFSEKPLRLRSLEKNLLKG